MRSSLMRASETTDRRTSKRERLYINDSPPVDVIVDGQIIKNAIPIDFSPEGIGLVHPDFCIDLKNHNVILKIGEFKNINVEGIIRSFTTTPYSGQVVPKIGIQFKEILSKNENSKSVNCIPSFRPTAWGEHPFKMNHRSFYTILSFTFNGCTMLSRSSKNIVFPGFKINLSINIPSIGVFSQTVEILKIEKSQEYHELGTSKEDMQILICQFISPKYEFLEAISSYLLLGNSENITAKELKDNLFIVKKIDSAIEIGYVENVQEWNEVLRLRLKAAQHAGRWIGETDHLKMEDKFDIYARQIICKVHKKIIGSGRVVFNDGVLERTEHFGKVEIPKYLFKDGFTEGSRVCTDPEYRGSDIFLAIVQEMGKITYETGHKYCLLNCEDSLVKIYKRFGGKPLGKRFYTPFMKETALNLMQFDVHKIFYGQWMSPWYWFSSWRKVHVYLKSKKALKPNMVQMVLVYVYYLVGKTLTELLMKIEHKKTLIKRYKKIKDLGISE